MGTIYGYDMNSYPHGRQQASIIEPYLAYLCKTGTYTLYGAHMASTIVPHFKLRCGRHVLIALAVYVAPLPHSS